ncbi:MAG: rhomboid family intramembrane serine protease [Acidobacteria bacterium]|nr:rhomboid family intramembrane serine protease [Acidobacteriota bacterium]
MTSGRDLFEPRLGLTIPLCGLKFIFAFLTFADPKRTTLLFAFDPSTALSQPWTFITYQFLSGTSLLSLFFGVLILYMLGQALEDEWGTADFTIFWLVATLGGSLSAWAVGTVLSGGSLIVNVSMLFAYAFLFPETKFYIYFVLPVKVTWIAWFTLGVLVVQLGLSVAQGRAGAGIVQLVGATAGFLYFWIRHHGKPKVKLATREVVAEAKQAASERKDDGLESRNRMLFPKVEALRLDTRAGPLSSDAERFASDLAKLVVPGVKICKPVDFKGDKDGICVRCEGFAECSLRYVAGQPGEITFRKRDE